MARLPPRVGVLLPSVNTVLEQELPSVAASAATFHFHRLDLPLSPEEVGDLARSVDRDHAEAIFLSCTDLPTFGVIESLEQELGKPVVSSNSASWWALTVALDIAGPISGPGRLFQTTGGRICQ